MKQKALSLVLILFLSSTLEAHKIGKLQQSDTVNLSKVADTQDVEIQSLGQKMSSLTLNMFNKKKQHAESKTPQDNEMIMVDSENLSMVQSAQMMEIRANNGINQKMLEKYVQMDENDDYSMIQLSKDDLNDSDIMAYSAINAEDDATDESAFSSGGAIMDALAQKNADDEENDPTIEAPVKKQPAKQKPKKVIPKKKAPPKKTAAQLKKEKDKKSAEEKEHKQLLVELEKQNKMEKESQDEQLQKEKDLLKNLEDSDKELEKEKNANAGGGSGLSVYQMQQDQLKADQTPDENANSILKVAHKGLIRSMMGSFGQYGPFG